MADVFVSYAKTDRSLASKVVAMLEAEGWKVCGCKDAGPPDTPTIRRLLLTPVWPPPPKPHLRPF